MWPYIIHFRKSWLYIALLVTFIYFWYYLTSIDDVRLKSYQSSHVNFKHLLVACVIAAQKGGFEVKKARETKLEINVKGKTKEGVLDVLTTGDKRSNLVMVNSLSYTFPGIKIVSEENFPASSNLFPLNIQKYLHSKEFSTIPDDIELNVDDLVIWIDPLDATKEYSEGLTQYVTTMVCVARKGEPLIGVIHQPFISNTYWASKFGIDRKLLALRPSFTSTSNDSLKIVISRSHKGDTAKVIQQALPGSTILEAAGSGYKVIELLKGEADIYLHKTYIKKWDVCAPNAILKYSTDGIMTTINGNLIDYDFKSDVLNKDGIFATAKFDLVTKRNIIHSKLLSNV